MKPRYVMAAVIALLVSLSAGSARAEPALDLTKRLIAALKGVKSAPEGGKLAPADETANTKAFAALDAFFDFVTFTQDCLGPSASKLSGPQVQEFRDRLTDILRRRGYMSGGSAFREGVVAEGKPVERGGATAVPVKISFPKQDVSMDVEFVWNKKGKIVDLALDGDSLSKDYRNQIGRILGKGDPADLLRRLAEKQKDLK